MSAMSRAGGLRFTLDSPVPGMSVGPDGAFTWVPPRDAPDEVRATVRVTNANGSECVHSFPLTTVK